MERAKNRIVRLLSCCLTSPKDISSDLLDYNLAWLWLPHYWHDEGKYQVLPVQKMYDFGLDEDVPSNWLVWNEEDNQSISVIFDLKVLHDLGVRGHFIINEVGTMTFEQWTISDHFIHTHIRKVTFEGDPDEITPVT